MKIEQISSSDQAARPRPNTFYPPKTSPFLVRIAQTFIRSSIRRKLRVTNIEIDNADLKRLVELQEQRCILTPSHSGGFEPHVLMYLSKLLGCQFNYVAAIELFERSAINRWVLPRLGVYSIVRGAIDRPSFSMTRQLLAAGKRWLVIFPEGETIWQNSTLLPFQEGVIQLACKGFEDARKNDEAAHLFCIPLAIKYVYTKDMHPEIDASLRKLENKLGLEIGSSNSRLGRLRTIAESVLQALENSYKINSDPEASLNDRVNFVKENLVSRLEGQLASGSSKLK
jgi:1-acyl-sn-glycerol-3-phosphate acyltransferase